MQHAQAALLLMLAFNLALRMHCTETSGVQHGQRAATAAAGPTTDATTWLSEQGDCMAYYNSRRTLTQAEQNVIASRTASHDSSCSKKSGLDGSCSTGDTPDSSWCPALLWTYTGTGNTMTRMLIEAASGWYTGSVYTGVSTACLPGWLAERSGHRAACLKAAQLRNSGMFAAVPWLWRALRKPRCSKTY